jgi:hypothetical protein
MQYFLAIQNCVEQPPSAVFRSRLLQSVSLPSRLRDEFSDLVRFGNYMAQTLLPVADLVIFVAQALLLVFRSRLSSAPQCLRGELLLFPIYRSPDHPI